MRGGGGVVGVISLVSRVRSLGVSTDLHAQFSSDESDIANVFPGGREDDGPWELR